MGEALCAIIGLLFIFGSISIFMSLVTEKHYNRPVRHSAVDNDLTDVIIADELFNNDDDLEEDDNG